MQSIKQNQHLDRRETLKIYDSKQYRRKTTFYLTPQAAKNSRKSKTNKKSTSHIAITGQIKLVTSYSPEKAEPKQTILSCYSLLAKLLGRKNLRRISQLLPATRVRTWQGQNYSHSSNRLFLVLQPSFSWAVQFHMHHLY